jgi:hypothetical protein
MTSELENETYLKARWIEKKYVQKIYPVLDRVDKRTLFFIGKDLLFPNNSLFRKNFAHATSFMQKSSLIPPFSNKNLMENR